MNSVFPLEIPRDYSKSLCWRNVFYKYPGIKLESALRDKKAKLKVRR